MTVEQGIKDRILYFDPDELVVEGQRLDLGNGFFYGNFHIGERLLPKYGGMRVISSKTRPCIAWEKRLNGKTEIQMLVDERDIEALGEPQALELANSLSKWSKR